MNPLSQVVHDPDGHGGQQEGRRDLQAHEMESGISANNIGVPVAMSPLDNVQQTHDHGNGGPAEHVGGGTSDGSYVPHSAHPEQRIGVDTRPMGNGQDGLAWAVAAAPPHSGGGWEVQPPPVTPPVMVAPQLWGSWGAAPSNAWQPGSVGGSVVDAPAPPPRTGYPETVNTWGGHWPSPAPPPQGAAPWQGGGWIGDTPVMTPGVVPNSALLPMPLYGNHEDSKPKRRAPPKFRERPVVKRGRGGGRAGSERGVEERAVQPPEKPAKRVAEATYESGFASYKGAVRECFSATVEDTVMMKVWSNGDVVVNSGPDGRSPATTTILNLMLQGPFKIEIVEDDGGNKAGGDSKANDGQVSWRVLHSSGYKQPYVENMKMSLFPDRDWHFILSKLKRLPKRIFLPKPYIPPSIASKSSPREKPTYKGRSEAGSRRSVDGVDEHPRDNESESISERLNGGNRGSITLGSSSRPSPSASSAVKPLAQTGNGASATYPMVPSGNRAAAFAATAIREGVPAHLVHHLMMSGGAEALSGQPPEVYASAMASAAVAAVAETTAADGTMGKVERQPPAMGGPITHSEPNSGAGVRGSSDIRDFHERENSEVETGESRRRREGHRQAEHGPMYALEPGASTSRSIASPSRTPAAAELFTDGNAGGDAPGYESPGSRLSRVRSRSNSEGDTRRGMDAGRMRLSGSGSGRRPTPSPEAWQPWQPGDSSPSPSPPPRDRTNRDGFRREEEHREWARRRSSQSNGNRSVDSEDEDDEEEQGRRGSRSRSRGHTVDRRRRGRDSSSSPLPRASHVVTSSFMASREGDQEESSAEGGAEGGLGSWDDDASTGGRENDIMSAAVDQHEDRDNFGELRGDDSGFRDDRGTGTGLRRESYDPDRYDPDAYDPGEVTVKRGVSSQSRSSRGPRSPSRSESLTRTDVRNWPPLDRDRSRGVDGEDRDGNNSGQGVLSNEARQQEQREDASGDGYAASRGGDILQDIQPREYQRDDDVIEDNFDQGEVLANGDGGQSTEAGYHDAQPKQQEPLQPSAGFPRKGVLVESTSAGRLYAPNWNAHTEGITSVGSEIGHHPPQLPAESAIAIATQPAWQPPPHADVQIPQQQFLVQPQQNDKRVAYLPSTQGYVLPAALPPVAPQSFDDSHG